MPNNSTASNPFPSPMGTDGYQRISGSCAAYETLRGYTGNLISHVDVVNVPCVGFTLSFYLTYNSLDTVLGAVGHKWRHNYMMSLILNGPPATYVIFVSPSGRQYGFTQSGGSWVLDTASFYGFFPGTLTQPTGTTWQISLPDGAYYTFDASGNLTQMVDPHGNATAIAYSGGNISTITEPTGRQITLSYSGGLLSSITDPNGNSTSLSYDGSSNLTGVVGPSGCTTTFGYATPSNHYLTSRTDPLGSQYMFAYDGSNRLYQVTDAATPSHTISYAYDTVSEEVGSTPPVYQSFNRTTLTDARGKSWDYRFDLSGNLRRIIDPLGHCRYFYWDQIVSGQGISQQKLLYADGGFPLLYKGNPHKAARRSAYDSTNNNGDLLYQADANGSVTQFIYDSARNLLSSYPGRAHLGVQGNWVGQYGSDGYLLCSFKNGSSDVQSLPAYVSAVTPSSVTRIHKGEDATTWNRLMDPRTLVAPDTLERGVGFWQFSGSSPQISIPLTQAKSFNLSVYTCANNLALSSDTPFAYREQFGHDITITVTDMVGTQSFRVYNNAPGVWVTFPVQGDATHPVLVTVVASGSNTDARISALMFDAYDSRETAYTYNATNDLLTITDPLGNQTTMTYNADGTMASLTDANSHQTHYYYEDSNKNLTRLVDASGAQYTYTYDPNGNVLTSSDPNQRVTTYTYDAKNRPLTVTDPLGKVTTLDYDSAGNLTSVIDANGNETQFTYETANRLESVIDALGNTTTFGYDGSGNRVSATDANGNTTTSTYDDAERMTSVQLADGATIRYAYDGYNRVRATTTPNGNQSDLSLINLTNAFNWVQNAGIESASPYDATQPRNWTPTPSGANNVRDTTVSHSGQASLKLALSSGTQYWSQANVPMPSGVSALLQLWARPDGGGSASNVWGDVRTFDSAYQAQDNGTPMTSLPAGSTTWVQLPQYKFTVPGDGQYDLYSVPEVRLYGQSSGTPKVWFDDVTLYAVSMAQSYDRQGNLSEAMGPDGARVVYRRDRFGRVVAVVDPRGRITTMSYDSLGRPVSVTDPLGNVTEYSYDNVGNLSSFTDPLTNITQYAHDADNRVVSITYPDATTEQFAWDPAGNLESYTNNRGQQKVFGYDGARRLAFARYMTDNTIVSYRYDGVGNLLWLTERNGDRLAYTYDAVNRMVGVERLPQSAGGVAWIQAHQYDNVGNRIQFSSGATSPVFDTAKFDEDAFAVATRMWSVPSPGFNSRNQMPAFIDALGRQTRFSYDVDGRLTSLVHPNGSPSPTSSMTYDVVGKLMGIDTAAATDLLPMAYGYDLAGNRIALVAGSDSLEYGVDDANRLVEEDLNRFVERGFSRFAAGTVSLCTLDPDADTVSLLPFADTFGASTLSTDRWRFAYANASYQGLEVRPVGGSLQCCFPRGFTNNDNSLSTTTLYGLNASSVWVAAEHRQKLSGDFDIQVAFSDYLGKTGFGTVTAALYVSPNPFEQITGASPTYASIARDNTPQYRARVVTSGTSRVNATAATSDRSGRFRIRRVGSTVTLFYRTGTSWTSLGSYNSYSTAATYVSLYFQAQSSIGSVGYSNFNYLSSTVLYPTAGSYTSSVYDAGRSVTWSGISWVATVPSTATLKFQVAVSSSASGPWTYVGPDGTSATYFTTSGTSLPSLTGRYFRYMALLSGDGTATPILREVDISCSGTNTSTLRTYGYDANGNLTLAVTSNASGAPTMDVRSNPTWSGTDPINNLNQIKRQDITTDAPFDVVPFDFAQFDASGGGLTTWRYTYDASGNMTQKTDGTNTWTYQWDEDNRLVLVTLPSSATIAYAYDAAGRMLTRTDATGTTRFEWDGFDCVREMAPATGTALFDASHFDGGDTFGSSGETQYYVVGGRLVRFVRDGVAYAVVSDALGSVRLVLDPTGAVVAHFEYDAWGNVLGSSSDGVPGAMAYRYVGAYGVRYDPDTELHYMRQRWYNPGLLRFPSRDAVRSPNRYAYGANNPACYYDANGLIPMDAGSSWDRMNDARMRTPARPRTELEQIDDAYRAIVNREVTKNPKIMCQDISRILKRDIPRMVGLTAYNVTIVGLVPQKDAGAYVHYAAVVVDTSNVMLQVLDPIPQGLYQTDVSPRVYNNVTAWLVSSNVWYRISYGELNTTPPSGATAWPQLQTK